jgi:MFS family permease
VLLSGGLSPRGATRYDGAPPMSNPAESLTADETGLLAHRSFVLFWCARVFSVAAYMALTVAVGWQVYDLTGNPLDLGLVGLAQFLPFVALPLLVGQVADRYDRPSVLRVCQIVHAGAALALAYGTFSGWLSRDAILALLFVVGTCRAFEVPTMHTLVPGLVPKGLLPRAVAAAAAANQTAIIGGPALGGLIYSTFGPTTVYLTCATLFLVASLLIGLVQLVGQAQERRPVTRQSLFAGFAFIRSQPVVLGAISLDLFAMLLGSVTALLPIFAKDILETGPWGLGLLRSAPAVGALAVATVLSRHSMDRKVGSILFVATVIFGVSILVFALSTSLALSIAALAIYGASDSVSVVIRHSLVQIRTPSEMLGRVMAINSMCTGSSSTLGEFRAGAIAASVGAVGSVLIGGAGALLVALLWMRLFPDLVKVDSMLQKQ